jgi:translocation protein SEC63
MAPGKAGTYEMELHVYSDSYMGLDATIPIQFTVRPADELPEYEPHPEDVELDNEPTLFEQVMAANVDDSSDDEDDDKPAAPAAVKKADAAAAKKRQESDRVVDLVGEDSEED